MKKPSDQLLGQLTGLATLTASVALTASVVLRLHRKIQQELAEQEAPSVNMPEEPADHPTEQE